MKKLYLAALVMVMIFIVTACGHTHAWEEASCTTPKTCSTCGETEGEALGHTWVEATCAEPKTCSTCDITEGEPLEHTVENWETTIEPTCTAEGTKSGICIKCKTTMEDSIPKTEHIPGEWVISKDATATSAGERTQSCTLCGEVVNTEEFTLSPEEIEAQYKESCVTYDYDTIARDPDKYMLTYGKYTGEIIQVLEDGNELQMRVNITQERYGYSDTIYVLYTLEEGESRLLEDDIITIYGMNMGTVSYQSVLGATITIPCVYAEYIDLN